MLNTAAVRIFRKALALKPDGIEGVLNNLDPEVSKLKELGGRLSRRRRYLQALSSALNLAPKEINKLPLTKMVQPLGETVNKIQSWLHGAQLGITKLNSIVKHQNNLLANAISEFAHKNKKAFETQLYPAVKPSTNFQKAAA